ncbi:MAG: ATP-binding protein [Acidaminococcaceae bacterium]
MSETAKMQVNYEVIGGDFDRAGEASSSIKRLLQKIGVAADIVRRIAIGTYEAEMNIIIHAGGGQIRAEISPTSTVVIITDQGPGISNIDLAMQEGWSTAPDYVREMGFGAGMGLPNMMKCSDQFDIVSELQKGTQITMRFEHVSRDLK